MKKYLSGFMILTATAGIASTTSPGSCADQKARANKTEAGQTAGLGRAAGKMHIIESFRNHAPEYQCAERITVITDPGASDERIEAFFRKLGASTVEVGDEEGMYTLLFPTRFPIDKVRWKKMSIVRQAAESHRDTFEHPLVLDDNPAHQELTVSIPSEKSPEQVKRFLTAASYLTLEKPSDHQLKVTAADGHLLEAYRYITSFGLDAKQSTDAGSDGPGLHGPLKKQ